MSKKFLFVGVCSLLATFAIGWEAAVIAKKYDEFNGIAQAVPIIRYDKIDEARNELIIGLFNPGTLPIEIKRTELIYEPNNKINSTHFVIKDYDNKPLVLDPGDTILVPLQKNMSEKSKRDTGSYWGQLDFRIPGQVDFYSLRHRFSASQFGDFNNSVRK
jgi:hypothetical protein